MPYAPAHRPVAALAAILHYRPPYRRHHLPDTATHTYRLAAGRHLVGIRPEPIQNRPKNTQRAEQPTSLTEGRLKTKPRG